MNIFNSVALKNPPRSNVNLSHEVKLSCNPDYLIPILHKEILPGDVMKKINTEHLIRMAPLTAPMMHRVNVYFHYFFVPNRLIWDEWEDFITGGPDGSSAPVMPQMVMNSSVQNYMRKGSLADFLEYPTVPGSDSIIGASNSNVLALRGYQQIYNDYYRDQNFEDEIVFPKTSGIQDQPDTLTILTLRKKMAERDYLTSCLPWAQRGGDVNLPMDASYTPQYTEISYGELDGIGPAVDGQAQFQDNGQLQDFQNNAMRLRNLESEQTIDTTAVTINDLRKSVRLQEWLEKNARAGSRYTEQLWSHFKSRSQDSRLQRAEFLHGSKSPVTISEVLQTGQTSSAEGTNPLGADSPQGNMAGHGISVGSSQFRSKKFREHGQLYGIMSIIPRTSYQQAMPKKHMRMDKFDFYFPEFAHLGEQEVKKSEVMKDWQNSGSDDETFGYQSRFAEYKFANSRVHGDFKETLNHWHLGRNYDTVPSLNKTFIESDTPERIFAVQDDYATDKFYVQLYNQVQTNRPMPLFSTPYL